MYVHIRHVRANFQHQEHSPVHFKAHEHDFQPASLNKVKILEARIFSARTSPVLLLCVIMNVCIKHKTKPPRILKLYRTEDWNWHHLQLFVSSFNGNTDIALRCNHHWFVEKLLFRYLLPFHRGLHAFSAWSTWGRGLFCIDKGSAQMEFLLRGCEAEIGCGCGCCSA